MSSANLTTVVVNPRLDFFTKPPVNVTSVKYSVTVSDPQTVPNGENPITFVIHSDDQFINFSESFLRFKLKVTQENGNDLPANMNNHLNFTPNIFHSLFRMVRVRVNDYVVTPANDNYSFKAFIDALFSRTEDSKSMELFTGADYDEGGEDEFGAANPAWLRRAARCNQSALQEYSGRLAVDFLLCSRNVLPNTKIEITLFPHAPQFVIQHDGHADVANVNFKFGIQDCQFHVRREEIASSALLAIEQRLSVDPAAYYFPLGAVKPYNIPIGSFSFRADDIFNNHMPQKIICGFVRSTSFNGNFALNPFYFNPTNDIEQIQFFKNGVLLGLQRPSPIDLADESTDKHVAFRELNKAVNSTRGDLALPFNLTDYSNGYFFAGVDLTPDGQDDMSHRYLGDQGSLNIFVKFRNATHHALELLIYGTFQEEVNITKSRSVVSALSV